MLAWPAAPLPRITQHSGPDVPGRVWAYDTAARCSREIGPADGLASLYVCGITPYDATHLGHAFTYLTFDLLNRAWRDLGLRVRYVQNITDVDDPLLERAAATGRDWTELAAEQVELFRTDMASLRILPPDHYVAATEAIDLVAQAASQLRDEGLIYQLADAQHPDWYFRTTLAPGYGGVAHLTQKQQLAQFAAKGGDPGRPGKLDPLDSLVWRLERPGEPAWDSPLGRGRPGWHIECMAIAQRYLGETFSVQGGGRDLAFPHHEMCGALGQAATREPFADAYVHVAMVGLDGEKMSKSRGNLELVSALRSQGHPPALIRLALLAHHYRDDWEWFATEMDAARARADAWRSAFSAGAGAPAAPVVDGLRRALRSDLDAPRALAEVDEWSSATLAGDGTDPGAPRQVAEAVDALLGVRFG